MFAEHVTAVKAACAGAAAVSHKDGVGVKGARAPLLPPWRTRTAAASRALRCSRSP